ncbi:MAG TPA: hypothetical protein VIR79_03395, partial [Nitrospira sp.]
ARLRHSEKVSLTLTRAPQDAAERLQQVSGVQQVHAGPQPGSFLLECELGRDVREDVGRLAVTSGWGLVELKSISMTLEDVFLQLTRHEEGLSHGLEIEPEPMVTTGTDHKESQA